MSEEFRETIWISLQLLRESAPPPLSKSKEVSDEQQWDPHLSQHFEAFAVHNEKQAEHHSHRRGLSVKCWQSDLTKHCCISVILWKPANASPVWLGNLTLSHTPSERKAQMNKKDISCCTNILKRSQMTMRTKHRIFGLESPQWGKLWRWSNRNWPKSTVVPQTFPILVKKWQDVEQRQLYNPRWHNNDPVCVRTEMSVISSTKMALYRMVQQDLTPIASNPIVPPPPPQVAMHVTM